MLSGLRCMGGRKWDKLWVSIGFDEYDFFCQGF